MRSFSNRSIAFLLALCMLLSVLPPVVMATGSGDGTSNAPVKVTYDFALEKTTLTTTSGGSFERQSINGTAVQGAIANYYANGQLNWKFVADSKQTHVESGRTFSSYHPFAYAGGNWPAGIRTSMKNADASNTSSFVYEPMHWLAFEINVEAAGTYDLTLNHYTRNDGINAADVYVIGGSCADYSAVSAALANAQKVNADAISFGSTSGTCVAAQTAVGSVALAAGANTVVFKGTARSNSGEAYTNGSNSMYLSSLVIEKQTNQVPEETTPVLKNVRYDFTKENLNNITGSNNNNKYFYIADFNGTSTGSAMGALTRSLYSAGTLNWKPAATNAAALADTALDPNDLYSTAQSYTSYSNGTNQTWAGLRLTVKANKNDGGSAYPSGHWFAFTLAAPGAGTYKATLNYQTRSDNNRNVKVYLIPGELTDNAAIEAAMTESLTDHFDARKDNDGKISNSFAVCVDAQQYLGRMDLTDGAYTLVIHSAGDTGEGFLLNGLELVEIDPNTPEDPSEEPEEPAEPEPISPLGYSFKLPGSALTAADGTSLAGSYMNYANILSALNAYYEQGILSWKYSLNNISSFSNPEAKLQASPNYYFGGTEKWTWPGLRMGMMLSDKSGEKEVKTYPHGWWTAFTIKSPGTGTYDFTLDYQTRADGTPAGEIYLVKGTFTDAAALEAKLTEENLIKVVNFKSNSFTPTAASRSLGILSFEEGEYTVVFKATEPGTSAACVYLDGFAFTPAVPKVVPGPLQTDKVVYDFELPDSGLTTVDGKPMNGATVDAPNVMEALDEYYKYHTLHWRYAASNIDSFKKEGATVQSVFFAGGWNNYKWSGIRPGVKVNGPETNPDTGKLVATYPYGWWVAMNLHSPGTGVYHLTLDYQIRADGTTEAEIYVIKGKLTDPAEIEKQMIPENLVSIVNMKSKTFDMQDRSEYLGAVSFEQGEFTLVVKAVTDSGNKMAHAYLNKLTADVQAPPEPTEIVYDFDLCDKTTGIWTKKKMVVESAQELADLYAKNKLNWKYESRAFTLSDEGHSFVGYCGMALYTDQEQWMAFRIKSPGTGTYTLSLNHATAGRGAMGAVYVLPGDTTDVEKTMDFSNRVGKVQYYNETGDTAVVDGAHTTLGTFNFEKGKEYIVVFEAQSSSIFFKNFGYMWVSQLIAKKGDYTSESAIGKRVIKPLVVDPDPVKTMELNLYMTTAEMNGMDYLYVGTEGHQMFMCNLEDMVKERVIKTPFSISRGMTRDKEGMIWVVGDGPWLFRYDPYTNTTMTTRNIKLAGGIANYGSGYSVVTDDEGNVYFGSYSLADIIKYDPQTDEFTRMGGGRTNDDCQYSCGLTVHDGYLYAAVSGDANFDGVRTAEAVKIDLKTNKIVGRTDIMSAVGPDEQMVRGSIVCGETLFMGGISMAGMCAIDINTMEMKQYSVNAGINYAPSEVVDGKCYLSLRGYGQYMYDSATDSLTKIKGMDGATVGFRCMGTSAVTLSNNPLFPGISHVTASSTGIKIYNYETKNVWTPPLYDEDTDGAGQLIRCIVPGEKGDENIYMGGFNTVNCVKLNTKTAEQTLFEATSAQTDVMLWHNGNLYVGNYNAGNLVQVNMEDPERHVILLKFKEQYQQARVHAIAAGDEYLFAGTIPMEYLYGGALAVINLKTQERKVEVNLIENQSITSLAYNDGIVFGGTSVSGGTGTDGSATGEESAVIFAYDANEKKLLATLDLREYFPELPDKLPYINGIVADPDVAQNGKLWGLVSETLFSFSFDKATNTFSVKEELSFDKVNMPGNIGRTWDDCSWAFDDDGYMYVAFEGVVNGGMRKINRENPKDNVRIDIETPKVFALGPDGNLYYSVNAPALKMYPLNVTEDDWQSAEAVDALIAAIGKKITLDSEAAILAARAAYESLSLKHKALVQTLETLQIAEIELLELKIDTIGEVTLDKRELIEDLMAKYESLGSYDRRFVKNYQILNKAYEALQGLINAQVAAEMQKIIDAMKDAKDITLDDYDYVMGIKAKYDALKFLQRQLVDATKLEAALAKITELRQEKIEYLKKLIASIGEVTLEDEPIITEAVAIFEWLTLDERNQVDYITLNAAEKALKKLQKAAAEEVDALIEAIGEVKRSSGKAIEAARAAYDALTEGSKAYVKLLDTLLAAEAAYAEFGGLGVVGTIAVVVAVLAAGGIGVTLVIVKKPNLLKKKQKVAAETEAEE